MKQIITFLTIFVPFSLYSQINESFDGPGINTFYSWKGDIRNFFINGNKELEFLSIANEAGTASIYLPMEYFPSMCWEIETMMDFKPTNSNNARLYVYQNNSNNGGENYYIQVGNNSGQVSLYRQSGTSNPILCISGRKSLLNNPYCKVSIRLELEDNEKWGLYTRTDHEKEYTEEGTYHKKLNVTPETGNFMISCRYIKSRLSTFWFDNLRITGKEPEPGEGEEPTPEPPLTPEPPTDPEPPLPPTPEPPPVNPYLEKSVIINEVMANPKGLIELPETEYVELYNTTGETISLENWIFIYGTQQVILPQQDLIPDGYLVLYRAGREITVDSEGSGLPLPGFPSALSNNGKELKILDPTGKEIDGIVYEKTTPGLSWEREEESWYLSTNYRGGTPGSRNSTPEKPHEPEPPAPPSGDFPNPQDIIFNELLPNPFPGGSEFIELYNRSGKTFSLQDLIIALRKPDGTLATSYPLKNITQPIPPEGYVVITKDKKGIIDFYSIPDESVIHEIKLPVLSNISATIVLFRNIDGEVIDEITYESGWHASGLLSHKGVSLERIDPDLPTHDENSWHSASALTGYATPGYQNSQLTSQEDDKKPGIEKPLYQENGTYHINYTLDKGGYHCRAFIYSLSGNREVEFANNFLLGETGTLTWDGTSTNGMRLRTGLYILYVEFYHPEGEYKSYKTPIPVR